MRVSVVENLQALLAERRERERVDKLDDLAQSRIDESAVTAHLAYPQLCALPEVVTIGLGDRDVELVANAILDRS